jgi:hypothetical protein
MEMARHERHLKDLHLVNLVYLCYFLSFILCLWNIRYYWVLNSPFPLVHIT